MPVPTTTREYRLLKPEGFDKLTLTEASIRTPKSTEVLVKVHAVSLQFRDLVIAKGQYPLGQKDNVVPGSDLAGEILAVGDSVTGWAVGDKVSANFCVDHIQGDTTDAIKNTGLGGPIDGVLTEYKILPAHSLVKIPDGWSYVEASTLPCAAVTAYNALLGVNPLKGGDTVLVLGTGGVSIFGLQIAVASGATVIATSSSDNKLEVAKKLGAKHVINYKKTPDWEQEVLRITGGRGVDHVIEVGGPGTISKSIVSTRYAGAVNVIGFVAGVRAYHPSGRRLTDVRRAQAGDLSSLPGLILGKAVLVRGILIGSRTQFEDLVRLVNTTGLKPVVDKVFAFEDLRAAYEYLESQQHVGKVVVQVAKA
ncbi:NAD-P-binding protein [Rhodofomes roseus]|uniref:NAD-P-binding protein n=1 Tax=Rhodofomes roseus TaxID=34475 RepID=A0ABQ8K942_9APHY|nr:NAD-P-binding protein [Rhodofomes roseus]KAH9833381.1 NAD-P-binding protein [Rhodofomes roseus]